MTNSPLLPVFLLAAAGCSKAPAEPEPTAQTASAAPAVTPLTWDVPGTWTALPASRSGPKKAVYKVEKAGNDKEDAELDVLFFGTGAEGDPDKIFKEMFGTFDGDVGASAKRERFEVRGMKVEIVDTSGTYKQALSPPVGPKKQSPVQMVKQNWRLHAAVVKTPDRGNWFFKLTGPDETVQAASPAFRTLVESAK